MSAPSFLNPHEARLYRALAAASATGPAPALRVAQHLRDEAGWTKPIDQDGVNRLTDRLHALAEQRVIAAAPPVKGLAPRWHLLPAVRR